MKGKMKTAETGQESACVAIGTTIAGLYFLSDQAKKDKINELIKILDLAITQSIRLGCEIYDEGPKQDFKQEIDDVCVFIENYCAISDPDKKKYLADLVRNYRG